MRLSAAAEDGARSVVAGAWTDPERPIEPDYQSNTTPLVLVAACYFQRLEEG